MSHAVWEMLERMALAAMVWTFVFWCLWMVVRAGDAEDGTPTEGKSQD